MPPVKLALERGDSPVVYVCSFDPGCYLEQFARMTEWLSPEEQARAQRFKKEADRRRFVLARAIVRRLCAAYLDCEPARIRLDHTPSGKPYLAEPVPQNRKRFQFNVSHSGACVLVAWTEGQPVGVDVEALDRDAAVEYAEVAAAAFSDAEYATLSATRRDEVPAVFYRIWVRKEAVLKGEGCGLSGLSKSFSVVQRLAGRVEWLDEVSYPPGGRSWRIVQVTTMADHFAALALPCGSRVHRCTPSNIGL